MLKKKILVICLLAVVIKVAGGNNKFINPCNSGAIPNISSASESLPTLFVLLKLLFLLCLLSQFSGKLQKPTIKTLTNILFYLISKYG